MHRATLFMVVLAGCTAVLAQNSSEVRGSATLNSTSAAALPTGMNSTTSNSTTNATSTRTTSTTPTTFPIATVPLTGYLAGTASAPAPASNGASQATGPDDSHIVSAAFIAPVAAVLASIVALGVGVCVLLPL